MRSHSTSSPSRLWFDVERRYKTVAEANAAAQAALWFDVERRYKTMWTKSGMTM